MITLILAIAALVFGIVSEVESNGRNFAGWACICLAAIVLIGRFG